MIATISLAVLCLSLLGALIYQANAHAKQVQGLIDRIEAPAAAQVAASQRILDVPETQHSAPEEPHFVPITDPDLLLDAFLQEQT